MITHVRTLLQARRPYPSASYGMVLERRFSIDFAFSMAAAGDYNAKSRMDYYDHRV
jgi:hypothetical protein